MPRLVAVVLCKNVCEYNLQLVGGFVFGGGWGCGAMERMSELLYLEYKVLGSLK
jgi:hypothetical protein